MLRISAPLTEALQMTGVAALLPFAGCPCRPEVGRHLPKRNPASAGFSVSGERQLWPNSEVQGNNTHTKQPVACASLVTAIILDQQLAGLRVCQRHTVIICHNSVDKHHAIDTAILFIKRLLNYGVT